MSTIIVFGAGGRAGRTIAAEARARGHRVTSVVRDPSRYPDLDTVAGDVTDPDQVAKLAAGHDAAVHAAASLPDAAEFFPAAAHALRTALPTAGVERLIVVGLASNLPTAQGIPLRDTPEHPTEYRAFVDAHAAGTDVIRAADPELNWAILAPSGDFDHTGDPVGGYRAAPAEMPLRITYPDFARAVVDEIERPTVTRAALTVTAP
ncbi:NAD(P)-dependent oxidoreductase [Nocardia sp. NPDC003482]|uniref:NAD(P)-dependent oxidoreductase n=1 Tax=Nocardia sp. NPDC004068 TaxID=3364303 RepID=UPI003693E9A9